MEDGSCVVKAKLRLALCSYFKFNEFRPGQLAACLHLATGSDKSLCMFIGPLASSVSAMAVIVKSPKWFNG